MNKLKTMDLFCRIVRLGNMSAAGREMDLSPPAVTTAIQGLEERLQVLLLERTTRSVRPTADGERYYDLCEQVLADIDAMESEIYAGAHSPRGNLRVAAPSDFGRHVLLPMVNRFNEEHPEVHVYLHLSDRITDAMREGFDIGFRYGAIEDGDFVCKSLGLNNRIACASPAYIEQHGIPGTPFDLHQHNCLVSVRSGERFNEWRFNIQGEEYIVHVSGDRESNDGAVLRSWAMMGVGVAYKSSWDVANDLRSGKLVSLFKQGSTQVNEKYPDQLSLIYPGGRMLPVRTRVFVDYTLSQAARGALYLFRED